jgi:hypothetical protein
MMLLTSMLCDLGILLKLLSAPAAVQSCVSKRLRNKDGPHTATAPINLGETIHTL